MCHEIHYIEECNYLYFYDLKKIFKCTLANK
jgi:hypothetical protein